MIVYIWGVIVSYNYLLLSWAISKTALRGLQGIWHCNDIYLLKRWLKKNMEAYIDEVYYLNGSITHNLKTPL